MAFYILYRFDEADIMPLESMGTAAIVLHQVVEELQAENYANARWLWCTNVLKMRNAPGFHDLTQDVDSVFLNHLASLVTIVAIVPSSCNSPLCPQQSQTDHKSFRQIVIRNPRPPDPE